jgi:hypothetical protein
MFPEITVIAQFYTITVAAFSAGKALISVLSSSNTCYRNSNSKSNGTGTATYISSIPRDRHCFPKKGRNLGGDSVGISMFCRQKNGFKERAAMPKNRP